MKSFAVPWLISLLLHGICFAAILWFGHDRSSALSGVMARPNPQPNHVRVFAWHVARPVEKTKSKKRIQPQKNTKASAKSRRIVHPRKHPQKVTPQPPKSDVYKDQVMSGVVGDVNTHQSQSDAFSDTSQDPVQQIIQEIPAMQAVDVRTAYANNPAPPYPEYARQAAWEGRVVLRVYVNAQGRPEQIHIQKSSKYTLLDDAALQTVRRWRFKPARRGLEAIASWVNIPISFRLDDD